MDAVSQATGEWRPAELGSFVPAEAVGFPPRAQHGLKKAGLSLTPEVPPVGQLHFAMV